jgi:hypothetical protein
VIIDRFAGDRQLFWVYGRYNYYSNPALRSETVRGIPHAESFFSERLA